MTPSGATHEERPRHRLSIDDYHRMAEVGILDKESRVELINGEIIDMTAIGSKHAATVARLARQLQVLQI